MSIKEISKVMKCFEGTVKSRLHYAKKKLENELENQDEKSCIVSRQILGKE
jgi:RNA polymerase sigma-70 factor (ECF subfamily)